MKVQTYQGAASFLVQTRAALELNEAANSLMLGVCMQLEQRPDRFTSHPCLKSVSDRHGLVLAAAMTPPHKLLVYGHRGDVQSASRLLAEALLEEGAHLPGVMGPTEASQLVGAAWAEVSGKQPEIERRQRVFELRRVLIRRPERGRLRQARRKDLGVVARWWSDFTHDVFGHSDREGARRNAEVRIGDGDVYLWHDVWPVAMAVTTRPTRHGISVAGVFTPAEQRNKGYATACVGELSRYLINSGWSFCSLFADVRNRAANRVYERIGYRPLWEYTEVLFRDD